jgi:hypothetical protein
MKSNSKPIVIIVLMAILLFLIILNVLLNKKNTNSVEHFQTTRQVDGSDASVDLFKDTHEFVEYSRNSDKLLDMFKSLEEAEQKCEKLESDQIQREEKSMMRENDKIYKELQEQDKKIHELKEIVKYLTIEKKRRDKINKNCMHNKQRKLNDNYNIVKSLSEDGFLRDNTVDIDLNVSESDKMKKFLSSMKKNNNSNNDDVVDEKIKKCNPTELDEIDLSDITDKCYGCDADKLKQNENYIRKDFE